MAKLYDFSGYATRNDLKCSDGRTIRQNAFKECDGKTVPLVWQHKHDDPNNVLGYGVLEHANDGVKVYGKFNDTEAGQLAKELVYHGDINSLSIYANQLKQKNGDVLHGNIREVSLVLSGANPGAYIETLEIQHSDDNSDEESAIIYNDESIELAHADEEKRDNTIKDIVDSMTEEQRNAMYYIIGEIISNTKNTNKEDKESTDKEDKESTDKEKTEKPIEHSDDASDTEKKEDTKEMADNKEKTIQDVIDSMTEEQKNVLYYIVGEATKKNNKTDGDEKTEMKHNAFESDVMNNENVLSHADQEMILQDAKRYGSVKEAFLAHADDLGVENITYGIGNIDYLFPEAKSLNTPPSFIQRDMAWVQKIMGAVHRTPFSRIKSMFADITEAEARAKGYIKGNMKKEEVFGLLKRTTTPTTVYKKQKIDRDDAIDIVDFDVVAWLKSEMRMMLDEELALAFLLGDGRSTSDDDKISELNIRPIASDADLFTIKAPVNLEEDEDEDSIAKKFIKTAVKARKTYKGSGSPSLFTTEDMLTMMILLEDGIGHRLYKSEAELATALRVKEIVTVEPMEGRMITTSEGENEILGVIVNPADYNVGADKGGAVNMFDDFDIDYNQQKYLIETRCSGALIKPFSAITLYKHVEA